MLILTCGNAWDEIAGASIFDVGIPLKILTEKITPHIINYTAYNIITLHTLLKKLHCTAVLFLKIFRYTVIIMIQTDDGGLRVIVIISLVNGDPQNHRMLIM